MSGFRAACGGPESRSAEVWWVLPARVQGGGCRISIEDRDVRKALEGGGVDTAEVRWRSRLGARCRMRLHPGGLIRLG